MANNTTQINLANEYHLKAMNYAQEALIATTNGDKETAFAFYEKAFSLEQQAANQFILLFEKEPTRSILFRSAASLAMNCEKFDEAEKMVTQGLAGNPPVDIANELRTLYEQIAQRFK